MTDEEKSGIKREDWIEWAKAVIDAYSDMRMTLRQIYYRVISEHEDVPNSMGSYNALKKALTWARRNGEVDYEDIEDRTREVRRPPNNTEVDPVQDFKTQYDILMNLEDYYTLPKWWGQADRVQVWVEKEALASVFSEITDDEGVDLIVCRGYNSVTQLYEAAEALRETSDLDIHILFCGDYDPSGLDIERAVSDSPELAEFDLDIHRIALDKDQVRQFKLPHKPAKAADSRYETFRAEQGVDWSVELDAIDPRKLQTMVRAAIRAYLDNDQAKEREKEIAVRRDQIRGLIEKATNPDFDVDDIED